MARESSYKPRRSEELATREVGVEENTDACSVSQLEDAILEQLATLSNATSSAEAENQLPISSANRNVEPDDRCGISSCIENIDVARKDQDGKALDSQESSLQSVVAVQELGTVDAFTHPSRLRPPSPSKESIRINAILNGRKVSSSKEKLNTIASTTMQRFRRTQQDDSAGLAAGLVVASGSGSNLFNLSRKDKGRNKVYEDAGLYSLPHSGSTASLKLPRPRSWVSSLMNAGSSAGSLNRLAKPSLSPYKQEERFLDAQMYATPPVSSLVLQSGFEDEARFASSLNRSTTRSTVGTLHLATMSTPNLPSSTSDEWAERLQAPLVIRNLDDAPRGTITPQVDVNGDVPPAVPSKAKSARKMTNPWGKNDTSKLPASMQGRLIMADEEEQYLDDVLARNRDTGRIASEEEAVLNMLDRINADVDTFDKPNITRARSRASSAAARRPATTRSEVHPDRHHDNDRTPFSRPKSAVEPMSKSITFNRSASPTIRAFASKFENNGSSSAPSIASSHDRRPPMKTSKGSVRKAVQQREGLDDSVRALPPSVEVSQPLGSGTLLEAVASTLRKKTSFAALLPFSTNEDTRRKADIDDGASSPPSYAAQTSSFLERRSTQKASRYLFRSPNQESQVSSDGYATSSSLWSRSDHAMDSPGTPATSPGAASEWSEKRPSAFGSMADKTLAVPPLLRRLRTDTTQATTMTASSELESDDTKMQMPLATPTDEAKAESASSVASSVSSCNSDTSLQSKPGSMAIEQDDTFRPSAMPYAQKELLSHEAGVSPNILTTPKRAKDLISFFEKSSAPSSPALGKVSPVKPNAKQLSPLKGESPSQAASRFRKALGASTLTNVQTSSTSESVDLAVVAEKIGAIGRTHRQRERATGAVAATVGGIEFRDPFSVNELSDAEDDEENVSPVDAMHATIRQGRGPSLFGGNMDGPLGKASAKNAAEDAGTMTDNRRHSSSAGLSRSTDTTPKGKTFRTSMKSIMNALSNGVNITGGDIGNGGSSDERRNSTQSSHITSTKPPLSYRDPSQHPRLRRNASADEEGEEAQSNLSSRTIGTSASFRQKTEHGQNLRVDANATLAFMGQPGVQPFRTGMVYYFNVHVEEPVWQRAQAVLLPSAIALSWIPLGGGRVSVVLDLHACREVHSVPGPEHPSSSDDFGASVARLQSLRRISPFQMVFDDGVERLAVESARDRMLWMSAVKDALGTRSGRQGPSARSRNASGAHAGSTGAVTDIVDMHMTTPRLSSPPPADGLLRSQHSSNDLQRFIPSGLAAVPLEDSKEDISQSLEESSPARDHTIGHYCSIAPVERPSSVNRHAAIAGL